jgi:hypothetical protein
MRVRIASRVEAEVLIMKRIALLSVLSVSLVLIAAGRIAVSAEPRAGHETARFVDDPPPEPIDCPLCGGNPMLHAKRLLLIETLESRFMAAALRW